jgi:hypothetical protein
MIAGAPAPSTRGAPPDATLLGRRTRPPPPRPSLLHVRPGPAPDHDGRRTPPLAWLAARPDLPDCQLVRATRRSISRSRWAGIDGRWCRCGIRPSSSSGPSWSGRRRSRDARRPDTAPSGGDMVGRVPAALVPSGPRAVFHRSPHRSHDHRRGVGGLRDRSPGPRTHPGRLRRLNGGGLPHLGGLCLRRDVGAVGDRGGGSCGYSLRGIVLTCRSRGHPASNGSGRMTESAPAPVA